MRIQELARKTGLTVYTLRFYEKEGLVDNRHYVREENNYRNYSDETIERLEFIKKLQSIGCSLSEIKGVLQEKDENAFSNQQIIAWIRHKIGEIEQKKDECDQIIDTLSTMIEYRMTLKSDPETGLLTQQPSFEDLKEFHQNKLKRP